jgi:hypothetical protein
MKLAGNPRVVQGKKHGKKPEGKRHSIQYVGQKKPEVL